MNCCPECKETYERIMKQRFADVEIDDRLEKDYPYHYNYLKKNNLL